MRAATAPPDLIDVDALRVGMYIHLDLGWMSHPFPLSSFKIASLQQIDTIRTLGLKHVRWSPHQSDPVGTDAAAAWSASLSDREPRAAASASASIMSPDRDARLQAVEAEQVTA